MVVKISRIFDRFEIAFSQRLNILVNEEMMTSAHPPIITNAQMPCSSVSLKLDYEDEKTVSVISSFCKPNIKKTCSRRCHELCIVTVLVCLFSKKRKDVKELTQDGSDYCDCGNPSLWTQWLPVESII